MKKGKPTKQQSRKIRDKLWSFYKRGCSASFIIQKTGFDKKTVYKYYNEWDKQILGDDEKNFQDKIRLEKERVDVVYDYLLLELDESLNEIKKEMKSYTNEPIPHNLFRYHLQFTKEIANIVEKRTSIHHNAKYCHLFQVL